MKSIVANIFQSFGFREDQSNESDQVVFWSSESEDFSEYYICDFILEHELEGYITGRFQKNVLSLFEEWNMERPDREKNTSLILFVDYQHQIPISTKERNKILQVEEDQFHLKKYVVAYYDDPIQDWKLAPQQKEAIYSVIRDEKKFEQFKTEAGLAPEYFIAMQLQTKLPFFRIETKNSVSLPELDQYLMEMLLAANTKGNENIDWKKVLAIESRIGEFLTGNRVDQTKKEQLMKDILLDSETPLLTSLFNIRNDLD